MSYSFLTINDSKDLTFNQLLGINDAGTIAGYYGSGTPPETHPNKGYTTTAQSPLFTSENFPKSQQTQVTGINNFGLTVGFWADGKGDNFGFVDNHGTFASVSDPDTPTGTPAVNQLLGVNDDGQAVGFYQGGSGNAHSYIYDITKATFQKVTIAGSNNVTATGINDAGVIAGFYQNGVVTDGFIDNAGSITTLTGPTGATATEALGLNNEGQVVGQYTDASGSTHGFLYNVAAGTYATIDDPNANGMTVVNGINDLGQLVGFYLDASGNTDGMLADIPGTVATLDHPVGGSTIQVPADYAGVVLQGSSDVTLIDEQFGNVPGGNRLLVGNQGSDTIMAFGTADTVIGGDGNNCFQIYNGGTLFLGHGANAVPSSGGSTIVTNGGTDTVAGAGDLVFGSNGPLNFIDLGQYAVAATNTVIGGGGATVVGGNDGVGNQGPHGGFGPPLLASDLVFGGPGQGEYIGGSGSSTFVGGSGSATVFGSQVTQESPGFPPSATPTTFVGSDVVYGGVGQLEYIGGSGSSTVVAGSGSATVFGGTGGGDYFGGANGNSVIFAGQGASTVTALNGDMVFLDGGANNLVVAGAGNVTLAGGGSTGNNFFAAGSGADLIGAGSGNDLFLAGTGTATLSGGGGSNLYAFVNGASGGSDLITDFKVGADLISLQGYGNGAVAAALQSAHVAGGSTTINLSDGTQITFLGVTNLTSSSFA